MAGTMGLGLGLKSRLLLSQAPDVGNNKTFTITADSTLSVNGNSISAFDFGQIRSQLSTAEADEFWNNVKSDGGDIRVYHDGTRLPIDIYTFDSSLETGYVFFDSSNHSASTSTQWNIEFGNSSFSQPAPSDTYGQHEVWSEYDLVSFDGGLTDRTENNRGGTAVGDFSQAFGGPLGIYGNGDGDGDYVDMGLAAWADYDATTATSSIRFLFRYDNHPDDYRSIITKGNYPENDGWFIEVFENPNDIAYFFGSSLPYQGSTVTIGVWESWAWTNNQEAHTFYKNGSQTNFIASDNIPASSQNLYIFNSSEVSGRNPDAGITGIFIEPTVRSPSYIQEEYNNIMNQSEFWSISSVSNIG